ncbi:porin [Ferrimonas pelagia]|uniref:Porin n=1 Tax=Ferrimonas pelagia TaxID=1177826 RepID=A0ABP9FF55_9GAMM
MMQTRRTQLATLTAALLAASFGAQATSDVDFYGSIRMGLDYVDAGSDNDAINGRDFLSRIGVKGSTDITDGIKGIAVVEYGLRGEDSINFKQNDKPTFRQLFVGLDTDYGKVTFGSQTVLYYTYVGSGYFSDAFDSLRLTGVRADDMLQYEYGAGNFKIASQVQLSGQDGDDVDQFQLAGQYGVGPLKLQAALVADTKGDDKGNKYGVRGWYDVTDSITLSAFFDFAEGDFAGAIQPGNLKTTDNDGESISGVTQCELEDRQTSGIYGAYSFGASKVHARYALSSCDNSGDVSSYKAEYTYKLNKQMNLWASYEILDADNSRKVTKDDVTYDDFSQLQLGVRYDF